MSLWLYAAISGVGKGRELDRLCGEHDAYRWICGGVWRGTIRRRFATTDHFFMPTTAVDENWIEPLLARSRKGSPHAPTDGSPNSPPHGTLEIGVHPDRSEQWREAERKACIAFAAAARQRGHTLMTWAEV